MVLHDDNNIYKFYDCYNITSELLQGWMFLYVFFYQTRYYTTQLDIAFYHKHNTRIEKAFKKIYTINQLDTDPLNINL